MIKLIKKWIEDEKAYKAQREKEQREELEKTKLQCSELDAEMADKWCPLVQGKCRVTCVNFVKSTVGEYETADYEKYYVAHKPKCKLWK